VNAPRRPYCCSVAELDGIPEETHRKVCRQPAPAVVRVQVDEERLAASVGHHIEAHRDHIRGQAYADMSAHAAARAAELRASGGLQDAIAYALTQRCHMQDGVVHAAPHVVAAVAWEVLAVVLAFGPDPAGQSRTEDARG
jgi:hypothetical protein